MSGQEKGAGFKRVDHGNTTADVNLPRDSDPRIFQDMGAGDAAAEKPFEPSSIKDEKGKKMTGAENAPAES